MKNLFPAIALFLFAISASSPASAACTSQSIVAGETKSGTLTTDDCVDLNSNGKTYYYDKYNFTGTSGQQISILSTSSVIDPDLLLIYPDGTTTSYDDNGGGGTTARIPPASGYKTLPATGTYSIVASSAQALQTGAYTLTLTAAGGGSSGKTTTEFYNTTLRHYFVTAGASEAAGIDNGAAGPGWVRTGHSFNVSETATGTAPVCRFYGTPGVGPNSHFYTADTGECTTVKKDPGWFYEGIAFEIQPAQAGTCPAGTQPIYRAYNNRWMYNDSNHRFITNYATYLQMGDRGWTLEGVVMCSTGIQSPTGITGGTFKDPTGAGVTVTPGVIPSSVNATQPTMTQSTGVPQGMTIDPAQGDVNVTSGAPAYDFNLNGDGGFTTTTAGAVTISLPFDVSAIPAADQGNTLKIFARIFNPQDGSQADLTGDISITGSTGILTVETRGLPLAFTAIVIYNPNMDAATSDEATALGANFRAFSAATMADKTALAAWPSQAWCVIYNRTNPNLIAAVKNLLGLAGNPSAAQIRSAIIDKVAGNARKSQNIYQTDGLNGPNLYIGRTACRDNIARYNIHMVDGGSYFQPNDPGEVVNPDTNPYGRLYISNDRIDDGVNTVLGSVLASVSHEMQHAIQDGYQIWGSTPKGYKEGTATIYGKSIDNGQVITVRDEIGWLDESLMTPGQYKYNNEDFFAYVGKQYNGGSLNYISGLYAQMFATIGAGVLNPSAATMYGAMNTYFNTKFSQSLQTIYLDFVKQRTLTHNASSQFGRAGEVVSGFAEGLYGATSVFKQDIDLATCSKNKVSLQWAGVGSFATRAIVINPTGVLPAGSTNPTLIVKITPASSSVGALWNGFTWRANTALALAATNKFTTFGKLAGDQIVVLVSNLDPANTGTFNFEIACEGVTITSLSPAKGPVDTSVTITGTGFGTAADTRYVYFNGLKASNVTWNSDTVAVAKVPQNASTGDVVVEVNTVKSNGVNFEVLAQCSSTQNAGADTPDTRTIELGKSSGSFDFAYNTYTQKDQILVKYQGSTLFDTGCVGASGTRALTYGGSSTQITVQVIPNCAGGSGTAWNYSVACPK